MASDFSEITLDAGGEGRKCSKFSRKAFFKLEIDTPPNYASRKAGQKELQASKTKTLSHVT